MDINGRGKDDLCYAVEPEAFAGVIEDRKQVATDRLTGILWDHAARRHFTHLPTKPYQPLVLYLVPRSQSPLSTGGHENVYTESRSIA